MSSSALILIDFINEIVDPKGKLAGKGYPAFVEERNVLGAVSDAARRARRNGVPVVLVRVGFSVDYREWPESSPLFGAAKKFGALQLGTWGTQFHPAIGLEKGDFEITKHRVSAFYGTALEVILRNLKIDTLLIGGVATDLAVQSAAREAHDRDFIVVVLEDLCAAGNAADHDSALEQISKIASVCRSTEITQLA